MKKPACVCGLFFLSSALTVLLPSYGSAQTFAAGVVGTVTDETSGIVSGVTVAAENIETGLTRTGLTNDSGNYSIPQLPPGEYKVAASRSGFKKEVRTGVVLQVGQEARIDFALKVGAAIQQITVRSGAPLVQTEDASVGNVIDHEKVVELPLNGREFFQLAQLAPNVFAPAQNSILGSRGFNVAGNSEIANNFSLDGTDNNEQAGNGPTHRPSIDAIKEFKVMTGTYNAEYGRNSGAQVIVTTKSGTNEFHGTLFEFHRNSVFDANNFFSPAKPAFRRNQFGGTAGGPIRKDKTFFFAGYEGLRLGQQISRLTIVPTAKMKTGDFSELLPGSALCGGADQPSCVTIKDPQSDQPFPGNRIPDYRLNPVGKALVAFYPAPNGPGLRRNFASSMLRNDSFNQFSVKIDHRLSDKNNFFASFGLYNDTSFEPSTLICGAREIPGFGCTQGLNTRHFAFSDVHVISPKLMHEFRFGYNRLRQPRTQQDVGIDFNGQFGIAATPFSIPNNTGLPAVNVTGFASLGSSFSLPHDGRRNTFHWVDNLNYNTGNHSLKGGLDIRRFQLNEFAQFFGRGQFDFLSGFTGNPLANLLLGLPNKTTRSPGNPFTYMRTTSYDFYIQDDWKVSSRLTLNAGLRYELNIPLIEHKSNNMASFDPSSGRVLQRGPDGFGDRAYNTDANDWAPRLGIAWRPFRDNRTVVRAGFGVFYNIQASGNGPARLYRRSHQQEFLTDPADPITLSDPFPARYSASSSPSGIDRNFRTAYTQQWSLNVQRELTSNMMVELGYLGLKGTHLPRYRDINQPLPGPGDLLSRRPFREFGSIWFVESSAASAYHGLELRAEKRSSKGLAFLASYTFSKSIDDSPGITTWSDASGGVTRLVPQNSHNLRGEHGLSDFDTRHRLVFSTVWQLPFGPGRAYLSQAHNVLGKLIGGWEIAGIATLQSGRPFTPLVSGDRSNTGTLNDRPNLVGDPRLDNPTPERWFNTSAFAVPPRFSFGNAGRNILHGDGLVNFDFALMRNIRLRENKTLQFRAESFNVFNHPNFALPVTTVSARFGTVPSTSTDPRDVQFGIKIIF